ncbi:MAG: type III secretion system chaperone [Candidatus Algichlamydia australiensis]|nr:type III secretion system chaperone [Chlamydiales bacterium]
MKEILLELAHEVGLTIFDDKEKKEMFTVHINPEVKVSLKSLKPGFELFAKAGKLPQKNKEDTLMHVMEANLLGQGTGGNILGMTKDEKEITLRFVKPFEASKEVLHDDLENFVNYLGYWRMFLSKTVSDNGAI